MNVQSIPIEDITIPPRQREDLGDVQKLADSINARGLLHPVTVVKDGDKFKLAAGERRIRAFQLLEKNEIPAKVYSQLSDEDKKGKLERIIREFKHYRQARTQAESER